MLKTDQSSGESDCMTLIDQLLYISCFSMPYLLHILISSARGPYLSRAIIIGSTHSYLTHLFHNLTAQNSPREAIQDGQQPERRLRHGRRPSHPQFPSPPRAPRLLREYRLASQRLAGHAGVQEAGKRHGPARRNAFSTPRGLRADRTVPLPSSLPLTPPATRAGASVEGASSLGWPIRVSERASGIWSVWVRPAQTVRVAAAGCI